jgi:hypothetical protein
VPFDPNQDLDCTVASIGASGIPKDILRHPSPKTTPSGREGELLVKLGVHRVQEGHAEAAMNSVHLDVSTHTFPTI